MAAAAQAATAPGSPAGPRTTGMCFGRENPHRFAQQRNGVLGCCSSTCVQRHFCWLLLGVVFWVGGCELGGGSQGALEEVKPEKTTMAKRRVVQRKPHFIKVLLGDFSQRLRIPPKFEKHFSGEHCARAILEGPTGGIWSVELQRTSKGMYLSEGWQNFVRDNTLQGLELLLFRYDGGIQFNVSVFDTTACERKYMLTDEGSASHTNKGLRKWGRPRKQPWAFGCHIRAERSRNERSNSVDSNMHGCYHPLRCLPAPQLDVEIKIEKDELPLSAIGLLPSLSTFDSSPDALMITQRGHRLTTVKRRCTQSKRRRHKKEVRGENTACSLRGVYLSQRRPVSLYERERAYEAAESFTSKFPFFIARMKVASVYRVFLLKVPSSFGKAHLPPTRADLVLEDPTGRAWPVRYIPNVESKLSGGWVAFTRGNNLEEGDLCVFELVLPLQLRVHIFRVVEDVKPLIKACSRSLMPCMHG